MYIKKVGTFGVFSASYCWSGAASAIGRLTQYLMEEAPTRGISLWLDDFHLEASATENRAALIIVLRPLLNCRCPPLLV